MKKSHAFSLLGGTVSSVAAACGVTPSAVSQWPEDLSKSAENRVLAALARLHLPVELLGSDLGAGGAAPLGPRKEELTDAA